jgi:hypothetical protein
MKLSWRFGIIAGIFLAVFTLYPQFNMWYVRGSEWQGNYAYNDLDEVAYAAYLRALIDGRPRKNDPYTGRDDSASAPQPESLFSIQFAAPYAVALPARLLGADAPWAMTVSGAVAGFIAALAVFWLVGMLTGNSWYGMAASLTVLAGGALAAGEGAIGGIFDIGQVYPFFPGFRRYIPAVAFPFFFLVCGLVWRMFHEESARRRFAVAALAALCFAFTVYSYFYIWTTVAAWLASVGLMLIVLRPDGLRRDIGSLAVLGGLAATTLVPYAYLLSQRADTMDHVQLLVMTREPDFARMPVYIGAAGAAILLGGAALGLTALRSRAAVFALSLCAVPVVLFNQQMVTGRSLQPIHYQVFIGNYVAAAGLMVSVGLVGAKLWELRPAIYRAAATSLAVTAVVWGFVECHWTIGVLDWVNEKRDRHMAVAKRLEELAAEHPDPHRATVMHLGSIEADDLPSIAPQNVVWARHQHVFAGLSWQESKERYYQWLHYQGFTEADLEGLIRTDFATTIALFGWGRHTDRLSSEYAPLTEAEIAEECARYAEFVRGFDAHDPRHPQVSFLVIPESHPDDLPNFDRWYARDGGEEVAGYRIYTTWPLVQR